MEADVPLWGAFVTVLASDGRVVGGGVYAHCGDPARATLLTCAHVINLALGRDEFTTEPPGSAEVTLSFPAVPTAQVTARVGRWWPATGLTEPNAPPVPGRDGRWACDLAELQPTAPLPAELRAVPLAAADLGDELWAWRGNADLRTVGAPARQRRRRGVAGPSKLRRQGSPSNRATAAPRCGTAVGPPCPVSCVRGVPRRPPLLRLFTRVRQLEVSVEPTSSARRGALRDVFAQLRSHPDVFVVAKDDEPPGVGAMPVGEHLTRFGHPAGPSVPGTAVNDPVAVLHARRPMVRHSTSAQTGLFEPSKDQ